MENVPSVPRFSCRPAAPVFSCSPENVPFPDFPTCVAAVIRLLEYRRICQGIGFWKIDMLQYHFCAEGAVFRANMADSVRFSRDGDQFHYLWAARRCLRLLNPSGPKLISIEGASSFESNAQSQDPGEEVIDLTEYYGHENFSRASFISYIQLKHSTKLSNETWPPSKLKSTLQGFGKKFVALGPKLGADRRTGNIEFSLVTNRPVGLDLRTAITDVSNGLDLNSKSYNKLKELIGLEGQTIVEFCKTLVINDGQENYLAQRALLRQETSNYLSGDDIDAPIRLKELVTRKALSESTKDNGISRIDVLRALHVSEGALFPAPSLVADGTKSITRKQIFEIAREITNSPSPVLIHAEGGVGKSVLTQQLAAHLPKGSKVVVYDCFGNGDYRRAGRPRHRHKDALIQIANELASEGLCDLLIPFVNAENKDYLRVFSHRLQQSASKVTSKNPEALICIVIDAADNAEMIAQEQAEGHSFVRDLIREPDIPGVRFVALSRTERLHLLDLPSRILKTELRPFDKDETAAFLSQVFPSVSEGEVDEFHRLTSKNPRVQAAVLAEGGSLPDILRRLGPNPTSVDDTLAKLLENAIVRLQDGSGIVERAQINRITAALAVLRPFVPVSVLARMAGVEEGAVRSFAADIGRPLLVSGDAIQFRDEPTETLFRSRFRPVDAGLKEFITLLRPLATKNSYVASALPQLMLEAGELDELVKLALSSAELPSEHQVERRDIELQRLTFALKASLKLGRYFDSAKLALKAGQETVGHDRQHTLFQENTDLPSRFISSEQILELVERNPFSEAWPGNKYAAEAALLACASDLKAYARGRLRMAYDWIHNWSQISAHERPPESVNDTVILNIAIAEWMVRGPEACVNSIRSWRPRSISYRVGLSLSRRWIDQKRYADLDELCRVAKADIFLRLSIVSELRRVHRAPSQPVIEELLRFIRKHKVKVDNSLSYGEEPMLSGILAVIEAAHVYGIENRSTLADILEPYLPPPPNYVIKHEHRRKRITFLRSYALHAALKGVDLDLWSLASPGLRAKQSEAQHVSHSDVSEFMDCIGGLLPWHKIRASHFVSGADSVRQEIEAVVDKPNETFSRSYERSFIADEIAELWYDIMTMRDSRDPAFVSWFKRWIDERPHPLFTPTWINMARIAARVKGFEEDAFEFSRKALDLTKSARMDAVDKASTYVDASRALLAVDAAEAEQYFKLALDVIAKLGDEVLERWTALLDLADRCGDEKMSEHQIAYRFARCAEVAEDYNSKHFDWDRTITAIGALSPTSAIAILSRWRDRGFGSFHRLLPALISFLTDRGDLDPSVGPVFLGFDCNWNYSALLGKAVNADASEKSALAEHILTFAKLKSHSTTEWINIRDTAKKLGIADDELNTYLEISEKARAVSDRQESLKYPKHQANPETAVQTDWDQIFEGLQISSDEGLALAFARFKQTGQYSRQNFFRESIARVAMGTEATFIKTFSASPLFSLYDYRIFFEEIPREWKDRLAVRYVLTESVKGIYSRFCLEISRSHYYQVFPLSAAMELSGLTEDEITGIVLKALSNPTIPFDSSRLFSLIGILVNKLSPNEALGALEFGIELFEAVVAPDDADGPWTEALRPPKTVIKSFAGLLYAVLGACEAGMRWQAAHILKDAALFGKMELVDGVVERAIERNAEPFVDSRMQFYHLHACQWLLISFSRIAAQNSKRLKNYSDFLLHAAGEEHVLIRHFASKALLLAIDKGGEDLPPEVVARLRCSNKSTFPVSLGERYSRTTSQESLPGAEKVEFHFGYDMDRYWFEPLGSCFGVGITYVAQLAEAVIRNDWQISVSDGWRSDERVKRNLYGEHDNWHSHSSYPKTDDLSFYLSYHAMMIAAGRLLATKPTYRSSNEALTDFDEWIGRHLPTRRDGFWLSDGRDAVPAEFPDWKHLENVGDWKWSVQRGDFDRVLDRGSESIALWGHWTTSSSNYQEKASIRSALVSRETSDALLRGMQNADDPYQYQIPSADDDSEIDNDGFVLKGWVNEQSESDGIDKMDPWSGSVGYPRLAPAEFVREIFGLTCDREMRSWCSGKSRVPVLRSEEWGYRSDAEEYDQGEFGSRLRVSREFLSEFLSKTNMELIIRVEIERVLRRFRYEARDHSHSVWVPPYFRIYVVGANGKYRTA
jgi:hypothetical protein